MTTGTQADSRTATRLMVLLFTDVVGSVAMKSRIGTMLYARDLARHDELFRACIAATPHPGELLTDLGDGFLARFETASDAVLAALRFQYALAKEPWETEPIRVRIGLHLGEVTELLEEGGSLKLVGLVADLSARLMSLALPGQVLLTRAAFDDARQYVREHPQVNGVLELRWMAHGPYQFHGADEPMDVFEVGARTIAPLREPPNTDKASRVIAPGEAEVLGWRPGAGLPIPGRREWVIDRKLGEGGFGEVWLGEHGRTHAQRVFKFCYDADRLRSFKRELTLFRLIRESLGNRPDIGTLYEVQLDRSPFYLESEFSEHGNLAQWAETQGGIKNVPIDTRIDMIIRTCEAVAAAHSVGILHKDLKPSNILVYETVEGEPRPRLSDFGIGTLADPSRLQSLNITATGFTESISDSNTSGAGTMMYAPPESLIGSAYTIQGDVYALGVILYQVLVGDLKRPLAQGWEKDIADPLLREDIAQCVAGRQEDRLGSALGLAKRLRSLGQRRRAQRRRHIARFAVVVSAVLAVALAATSWLGVRERRLREQADRAAREAEATVNFLTEDLLAYADPEINAERDITMREVLDIAAARIEHSFANEPLVEATIRMAVGRTYSSLGLFDAAAPQFDAAFTLRQRALGDDDVKTLEARLSQANDILWRMQLEQAMAPMQDVLADCRTALGDVHPLTLEAMFNLAHLHMQGGENERAMPLYEEALAGRRATLGENDPDTLETMEHLAELFRRLEQTDRAEELLTRSLRIRRAVGLDAQPDALEAATNLANLYRRSGRLDEAELIFVKTLETRRRLMGPTHWQTLSSMNYLASLYVDQGRDQEAEDIYVETLELRRRVRGDDDVHTLTSASNLARLFVRHGRFDEALPLLEFAVDGAQRSLPAGHWYIGLYMFRYAECLAGMERYEAAAEAMNRAYLILETEKGPSHERTIAIAKGLIKLYEAWGDTGQTERWKNVLRKAGEPNGP